MLRVRARSAVDRPVAASPSSQDAQFAISSFAGWINNADAKAGFLAAGLTVLVGTIAGQRDRVYDLLPLAGPRAGVAVAAIAGALVTALVTAVLLGRTMAPRTANRGFSRYAWPSVAASTPELLDSLPATTDGIEAWRHAYDLAVIAKAKFHNITLAIRWLAAATVLLLVWHLVAPA
jgi:hypothetical protein